EFGPAYLFVDASGNVYNGDYASGGRIRKISTSGIISTVAGGGGSSNVDGIQATAESLNMPDCPAFDSAGNLYIAEEGNYKIRKVNPSGVISTFAGTGASGSGGDGGQATAAQLNLPRAVAIDAAGN